MYPTGRLKIISRNSGLFDVLRPTFVFVYRLAGAESVKLCRECTWVSKCDQFLFHGRFLS